MDLHALDILLFMHDFEPSRIKMWEIVRRYDSVQMATFLYLLENVQCDGRRVPKSLKFEDLCKLNGSILFANVKRSPIRLSAKPALHIDRVEYDEITTFGKPGNDEEVSKSSDRGANINEVLVRIRNPDRLIDTSPDDITKMLVHNLGTKEYKMFLKSVKNLLFNDSLQTARGEIRCNDTVVPNYLSWSLLFSFRNIAIDPSDFHYMIIHRPRRVYESPSSDYLAQPLYQGFRLTIDHDTEDGFRYYNRYGESTRVALKIPEPVQCEFNGSLQPVSCTFEAILLPLDAKNRLRSWRYWKHRSSYIMYVTDVYRFGNEILMGAPFQKRFSYVKMMDHPKLRAIEITNDSKKFLDKSLESKDMCDPRVGIIYRGRDSTPNEQPEEFRFNIRTVYYFPDNLFLNIESQSELDKFRNTDQLYFDFEMADRKIICLVYAHTSRLYHICVYNHTIHQFEHFDSIERLPYDVEDPVYRSETLIVIGAREIPRGILLLRLYFDRGSDYIGYENKFTQSQYDVPLRLNLRLTHNGH